MDDFEGWTKWLEPAVLLWEPTDDDYEIPPYMTRTDGDGKPNYTPDEEFDIMDEQVNKSDGFDIDFSPFRCVFNYHPAVLDSLQFVKEPETSVDLLSRLSKGSLDGYNKDNKTEFEFVKVVRANYHFACAIMFLITFQVKDPYDGLIKNFQARVRYAEDIMLDYVFCRPQPHQKVACVGVRKTDVEQVVEKDVEKDGKKPRLD
ncbi:hypothetical protein AALP_AA2G008900 [Arabis alpina]|uniref:Cystatin domain-containing protein n=1 Tax=Arabis alpina TaxID=50452 RepID=A0A087HEI7_ARAAL|nr:hypothetical protein AALP_AA2G008900 [Arabis alpina]